MKSKLLFILVALLPMAVLTTFTSCSEDEEEPEKNNMIVGVKNNMIVGVWKESISGNPDNVLTLNANGTFDFYVYGSALTGKGNYTYDEITRTLALFYTSGGSGDRTYIVQSLTDNYMVLMDHNGDNSHWRKNGSESVTNSASTNTNENTLRSPTELEKSLFNTSWKFVKRETYSDGKLSSTLYNDVNYTAIKLSSQSNEEALLRMYYMYQQGSCVGVWYEDQDQRNYLLLSPIYIYSSSDMGKWIKYQGSGFVIKHTSSELILSNKYSDSDSYYSLYYYTASNY